MKSLIHILCPWDTATTIQKVEWPALKKQALKNVSVFNAFRKFKNKTKRIRWRLMPEKDGSRIVFILGCQRSGKTLLMRLLDNDKRILTYYPNCTITDVRLKSKEIVDSELSKYCSPISAIKLPAENQNAAILLDTYLKSSAIWVFRDFRDTVFYNLTTFSTQVETLKKIFLGNSDWRGEKVSEQTLDLVRNHFSESMSKENAAALFWYCRNILFFEQQLHRNSLVLLINYDRLVKDTSFALNRIYSFMNLTYPRENIIKDVKDFTGVGHSIKISPSIISVCDRLYRKLKTYEFVDFESGD